ncbi:hypothetical protein TNCT_613871, partial [Trichonephila clavata]
MCSFPLLLGPLLFLGTLIFPSYPADYPVILLNNNLQI